MIALRELFLREIGQPRWAIIYGQSLGGHIVVATLELHPGLYQGGLAECGLVDGIGIADYLLAYTAAAELISGVRLLDAPDKTAFAQLLNDGVVPALGTPGAYTERGRQFDSVVKYLLGADASGHDLPLRLKGLRSRYLLNMIHRHPDVEQEPMPGGRAASTVQCPLRIDPGLGLTEEDLNKRCADPPARTAVAERESGYAERPGRLTVPLIRPRDRRCLVPLSLEQATGQDNRCRHGPSARPARRARAQPLRLYGETREQASRPVRVDRARCGPRGDVSRAIFQHRDEVDAGLARMTPGTPALTPVHIHDPTSSGNPGSPGRSCRAVVRPAHTEPPQQQPPEPRPRAARDRLPPQDRGPHRQYTRPRFTVRDGTTARSP